MGAIQYLGYFFDFLPLWQFIGCFGVENESRRCRKAYGWIPHIFIFVSVYYERISGTRASKRGGMTTQKKYVNLCHFGNGSKCTLRGGRVSRANRVNRRKRNRALSGLSFGSMELFRVVLLGCVALTPLHTPPYLCNEAIINKKGLFPNIFVPRPEEAK